MKKKQLIIKYFFFFHAEDCIRDFHVTGVQTCALPIAVGVTQDRLGGPRLPLGWPVELDSLGHQVLVVRLKVARLEHQPLREPGGIDSNQVTSVSAVVPPFGPTWTQRIPGMESSSRVSWNPSLSR